MDDQHWFNLIEADYKAAYLVSKHRRFDLINKMRLLESDVARSLFCDMCDENYIDDLYSKLPRTEIIGKYLNDDALELLKDPSYDLKVDLG